MTDLPRQNPFHHVTMRNRLVAFAGLVSLFVISGCDSDTAKTTVDPPPIASDLAEQTPSVAPGSLELPKGEIVENGAGSPSKSTTQPASAGMEMPNQLNAPNSTGGADANDSSIELNYGSWEEVQKLAQSSGKITVLDIWSTACVPCIRELPGLVELHKSMGDKVQCMTMDIDFDGRKNKPAQTYEDDILTILKAVGATFPNYACTTASDDVYAAAQIDSIPAVLVFQNGKLVKQFVDAGEGVGFGYHKDVIPFVKTLLK